MTVTNPQRTKLNGPAQTGADLDKAVRDYVRTCAVLHGKPRAAETLGVSRHTLWRFLHRGHAGRAIPRAVLGRVGGSAEALNDAEESLILQAQARRRLKDGGPVSERRTPRPLSEVLADALGCCAPRPWQPWTSCPGFGRVPASTMRERLGKLAQRGLVDSAPHQQSVLGSRPQRRYFPTGKGIAAGGRVEHGTERFLSEYPVSKQWFRLLAERMDAVAVLYRVAAMIAYRVAAMIAYRVAAMIADADPHEKPVRVDHYRNGPYDMLITLSGGRSIRDHPPGSDPAHLQPPLPPEER